MGEPQNENMWIERDPTISSPGIFGRMQTGACSEITYSSNDNRLYINKV